MESGVLRYRFYPIDQEILCYYLPQKMVGEEDSIFQDIKEIILCETDPWDLAALSQTPLEEGPWHFFYQIEMSFNDEETNRTTPSRCWQCTGRSQIIKEKARVIGMKKILEFHGGQDPTSVESSFNWVTHESHLRHTSSTERVYVIGKPKMKY